jgi:hypothetical protein
LVHFIFRKDHSISLPFLIGLTLHLILDLPEVPLLYPFVEYDFIILEDPFGAWLYTLFNEPVVYLTEISGSTILFYILVRNRLFNPKEIYNYLKKHSEFNKDIINNQIEI